MSEHRPLSFFVTLGVRTSDSCFSPFLSLSPLASFLQNFLHLRGPSYMQRVSTLVVLLAFVLTRTPSLSLSSFLSPSPSRSARIYLGLSLPLTGILEIRSVGRPDRRS